ncbi:MAG TPA: peptidase M15 [Gammaproteobacteria bacterium]|nr:peptidase M15 [Gammaproteobacteria bacterium]
MDRRNFLKLFSAGTMATIGGQLIWRAGEEPLAVGYEDISTNPSEMFESIRFMSTPAPDSREFLTAFRIGAPTPTVAGKPVNKLRKYLSKMDNFEHAHVEDVYLDSEKFPLLVSAFKRLDRVQNLVGHGNFNILSFDDMRVYGKRYSSIGTFPSAELGFLEETFSDNVSRYGFFGEKVTTELTMVVPNKDRIKVHRTGHFLFKGDSYRLYKRVKKDLGSEIVLTSGIRSIVKQTHLFLAKTIQTKGNLSQASRSLAPPGHSFHGVGDFDVGKVGFGRKNFTSEFARTKEFRKLVDLGYVNMRYPQNNLLGVRYEPWHIKVV